MCPPHPPKQAQRSVAATSLPAALCPPVAGLTPGGEVVSSVERASFPGDSPIVSVAPEPLPALAQAEPIVEVACCLQQLSNYLVSAVVMSGMKEGHLESLCEHELHLGIKRKE